MTQRVRRHDKRIIYLLAAVFVATFSFAFLNGRFGNTEDDVEAASLANFDAGNIISDYVMGNFNSMSESDIQNFLTSKNSCSNTDYDYYRALSNGSSYEWHWANGHFVCLSEEKFGDGETIGSGDTAAHIIYQAAQDYKINPQVLIVLLQKETGLITDPIPNNGDYRKATGYGCPDTAACSSKYYGFKNQVRHAAALFRDVLDGGWTNYPLGNNYIQYNPNSSCGGSTVNIQNLATSALYRYTPYQPNSGALEAGYGTAYCGSYGNRNFYLYFNDWFGDSAAKYQIDFQTIRIPDGIYTIQDLTGRFVGTAEASTSNSANVKTVDTDTKKWKFHYNKADKTYSITETSSGRSLDIYSGIIKDGSNIQLYDKNDTCAQKWQLISLDNGQTLSLISACSNQYEYMSLGLKNDNVELQKLDGRNAQKWKVVSKEQAPIEDGEYNIKTSDGLAISVKDSNKNNGANIQAEPYASTNIERFTITRNSDGSYAIKNSETNKNLDITDIKISTKGANVQQFDVNSTCAQKWFFKKTADSTYTINAFCSELALVISKNNNAEINNALQEFILSKPETAAIKDGNYSIISKLDAKKAVDVSGASLSSGANVQLYQTHNTTAQKFHIQYVQDGNYYIIKNVASNKSLDVSGGVFKANTNVWQYDTNNTTAQKWRIGKYEDYYYITTMGNNNLALTIQNNQPENGANINIETNQHSGNQLWSFVESKISDGVYTISSKVNENFVIDVDGGSTKDGANIQLWLANQSNAQKFQFEYVTTGDYYIITNVGSGKVIDLDYANTKGGTNIKQWTFNDSCAQHWKLIEQNNNFHKIASMCSNDVVLDLNYGLPISGNNIQIYQSWGNNNQAQLWKIK